MCAPEIGLRFVETRYLVEEPARNRTVPGGQEHHRKAGLVDSD
jgi:hypothetical protein